jgi:hypothetical protein
VTGQLANLDLGRLVTDHFPHKLTGIGQVTILSSHFRRGRLEEGSVIVAAGPGTVDRSFLAGAVDRLNLVVGKEPAVVGDCIAYDELAFCATLDSHGLRLAGRCGAAGPGAILSDGRNCLLGEPSQPQPLAALVQTLAPPNALQVPASRQTDWLLHHLPVPEVMPLPGSEALPAQARRLRLKDPVER